MPKKHKQIKPKPIFGCMKGTLKIHGDIMSTGEEWHADLPDSNPNDDPLVKKKLL